MAAYIYNVDSLEIAQECENLEKAQDLYCGYDPDEFGITESPGFGAVDGLHY